MGTIAPMSGSSMPPQRVTAHDEAARDEDCFAQDGLPRRFGRYNLLRLLARGGMGQVFLASTTGVEGAERPVVVKVIRREYAKDPNFLARFLDEARVQAQLQHSGVAQVLEADTHEPSADPYVVIEYIEGRSLGNIRQRAAEVGLRLRWEDAVAIGTQVMDALAHIHERKDPAGRPLAIVHRDLSPHNVMVGYSGEIKIIDFGTARGQNRRCRTVAGVVFAKPGYVAPEVANGEPGDARVDLYAAGIMIWELCAGRRFLQGDPSEHLAAVARNACNVPAIASLVGAPAELDTVIAKLTAFDRDSRYDSSRIAAAQLATLLSSSPPLPNGERGVRARVAQLAYELYPTEPGRSRRRFAKLVATARTTVEPWEQAPSPEPPATTESPAAEADLLAGTRYRLRQEIGRGASSVVYEAEHLDLGRHAAVKVLHAEHTHSKDYAARFRREARALSRVVHPGLVRVYDFGQAGDGRLFCAMELLEGQTLRARLDQGEPLDWKAALRIARQCCLALEAAHGHGVVHRDIKPANIFLANEGRAKLIDFSLAKTAEEVGDAPADDARGADGAADEAAGAMTVFGTPDYMAPEQAAGGRVDACADVYALGCVLYEMLTGRLPFVGKGVVGVLDAKLRGNPEPVRDRAPNRSLPRSVDRLVMKALARHPSRRFQSAMEMADAIELCLDEPSRVRARRRAAGYSIVAAVMAFAVVLLGRQLLPTMRALPAHVGEAQAQAPTQGETPELGAPPAPAASHAAPTPVVRPTAPRKAHPASSAPSTATHAAPVEPEDANEAPAEEPVAPGDGAIRVQVDKAHGGPHAASVVLVIPDEEASDP